MQIVWKVGEERPQKKRKERSDKRVRSTLRISKELQDLILLIAYNHHTSKQKVIDRILHIVLTSDKLRYTLTESLKKETKTQKLPYIVVRQ